MRLTITNKAAAPVPVMSNDGGGWVQAAEPGAPLDIDRDDSDVIIVGDKPSVTEQIQQGLQVLAKTVKALVAAWRKHHEKQTASPEAVALPVSVDFQNRGANPVRAILGDGVTDVNILPGALYHAEAPGYVELRELGKVAVDPNQHEAS